MDDVLTELRLATESIERGNVAHRLLLQNAEADRAALWADLGELRDELHAVANRVENLTRALTTEPAEVAARIVTDANRGLRDANS